MKVLAVDTSSRYGVVGLSENGQPVAEISCRSQENHSARLLPSIDMMLELAGWKLDDIDAFGVVIGPGSFTGLRVGLATIKGLAWSKKKPVVPISSLEVLAWSLAPAPQLICPMMDARKGRVYGAIYQFINQQLKVIKEPSDIDAMELVRLRTEGMLCVGEGVRKYLDALQKEEHIEIAPESFDVPRGSIVARLAYEACLQGKMTDVTVLEPIYLRLSEAEVLENAK